MKRVSYPLIRRVRLITGIALIALLILSAIITLTESGNGIISYRDIPAYNGRDIYVEINGNIPFFEDEITSYPYEIYSELDSSGRCGSAVACLGIETMPKANEERESIYEVKPSGWHSLQFDGVEGGYLYNRCHLIGWQLSAENANEKNLITGTRDFNVRGMLPFENMVADYVKETENHVLYRVTPVFKTSELVARGVLIECKSVEDNGEGLTFCVFVYNVQSGIKINYLDGSAKRND